jgi:hypothetical protein
MIALAWFDRKIGQYRSSQLRIMQEPGIDLLVVRALKISQLTDGGMPPTYDSMH